MSAPSQPLRIVVGVTGASGAVYAKRLIECLLQAEVEVHVVASPNGRRLFADELSIQRLSAESLLGAPNDRLTIHPYHDVGSVLGSGSFLTDGMIVCPCSTNTLASIANGHAGNLLDRAASVTLKEKRRLVVVPREMPFSPIDLRNAWRLAMIGAIVSPACPGFYLHPKTISDIVDFVVGRLLDLVGVPHVLDVRWESRLDGAAHERGLDRNV